ncbi:MAG: type II secretion system F family protein [Erysipelotrichaceae bacterium]|nr:type II secretion system F family protein [Erysipelotrichaceae bacterium]
MKKRMQEELALFCEQMAMILESGMALNDSIRTIAHEVDDKEYAMILNKIADDIDENKSFSEALKDAKIFDDYMIKMVDVGERSGYLDSVMRQLTVYYQRLNDTNEKLKDALTYPGILVIMMLGVITLLVVKVLPMFETVLNNMGVDLGGFAYNLMNFGNVLARYGLVLVFIVVVLVIYMIFVKKDKAFISKRLSYDLSVAQFAFAMSLFLNSGYNIDDALDMIPGLVTNAKLKNKVEGFTKDVHSGMSIGDALTNCHIFKSVYNRILVIGFKAGKGDEAMGSVAKAYENEVDNSINKMLDIVEPTLVGVLSIIVGIILLSVMLPLMSIMSSL